MTLRKCLLALGAVTALGLGTQAAAATLTIATVNNGDMIRMQMLADDFRRQHPDIELQWVTLEENLLRQRVTIDVATQGGQYDVVTVGNYEVPIWAQHDWLVPLEDLGDDFASDDLLPAIHESLSYDGRLYAAPFYGESAMVMYRTDLAEDRTVLANERTFAGWLRTGFAAVGIGLAFHVLFGEIEPPWVPRAIATVFLCLAMLVVILAERRAAAVVRRLNAHVVKSARRMNLRLISWSMVSATAALIVALWTLSFP